INLYFPSLGLLGIFLLALGTRYGVSEGDDKMRSWSLSERGKKLLLLLSVGVFIFYAGWITRAYVGQIYIDAAQRTAQEGDYELAMKRASAAIRFDSTNSEYYRIQAGFIISGTQLLPQIDEAITAYQKAITLDPFTPHFHYELSKLYIMRGMPLKGFLEAKEAERLFPLSSTYRQFAREMEENLKR
ncbi:MAG: tetratricopeptide repeat protein, partial [Candidatus Aminicenantes bacterium]|nr:tetratricopeptide repeat protein [Candidatus Aminicenantes bacterium]